MRVGKGGKQVHLPFHDPRGEPLESFIQVRDDIRERLVPAVAEALGLNRIAAEGHWRHPLFADLVAFPFLY